MARQRLTRRLVGRITELRVPTTLIVGDKDQAVPLDFQRKHTLPLVEKTGGKLIVIEDAAHMLPNEATVRTENSCHRRCAAGCLISDVARS